MAECHEKIIWRNRRIKFKMNHPLTNVLTYDLMLDLWKQDSFLNVAIAFANLS